MLHMHRRPQDRYMPLDSMFYLVLKNQILFRPHRQRRDLIPRKPTKYCAELILHVHYRLFSAVHL